MSPRRRRRRLAALALSISAIAAGIPQVASASDPVDAAREALARSEREAADAQRAANAATAEYQRLTAEQAELQAAEASIRRSIQGFTERYEALLRVTRERALIAYKRGGTVSGILDPNTESAMDVVRRDQLAGYANDADHQTMRATAAARDDLETQRQQLEARRRERAELAAQARRSLGAITARLETARAAQSRYKAELARALEARSAELRRAAAAAAAAARARAVSAPRAPSGGGGGAPAVGPVMGGLVCPIAGPTAFSNDWQAPRPGGTRHEGTDVFSARGTPNVAMVSGTITQKYGSRQGYGVHLIGDNGVTYYYFHLASYAGAPRRVSQGEVIGYTGNSGATSAVHTHIEIHPGGGAAVNPYPTLRSIC